MNNWLDNFQMMGAKLNEGEKALMRFAMSKERERIIQLLQVMRNDLASCIKDDDCLVRADAIDVCISDIKGENNV